MQKSGHRKRILKGGIYRDAFQGKRQLLFTFTMFFSGGMIPKVDCCVQAVREGVASVHIIDGRQPHSILYEAFSPEGSGTTVGAQRPSVGIKW